MSHVVEDLELYAFGVLTPDAMSRVDRHLAACPPCRAAANDIRDLVALLPEAIPLREPPPALKLRILEAARAERRPRAFAFRLPWSLALPDLRFVAMAAAIGLLLVVDAGQTMTLRQIQAERDEYASVATDLAHGGRTWYMAGVDRWRGSGGNLIQPATGDPAFVVFHGLRELSSGQTYALWLISPDGKWARGNNFRSDGREVQIVDVGLELQGFDRCAVTVETRAAGKPEGPVVMQATKIVPLTQ